MAPGSGDVIRTLDQLVETACRLPRVRVAVAVGHDPDAIEALDHAESLGLAEGVYVGDPRRIRAAAATVGVQIADGRIVADTDPSRAVSRAISLVREREADLLMKGRITTAELIRAILDRETGLRGGRLLSQVVVFEVPGIKRLMLLTDAAINVAPTLAEKADICRNAIEVAHAIGVNTPKVALLCALELVSPGMPATVDAAALAMMNRRGQIADAVLDGPIALDAVLSRFAADRKGLDSPLVETADVLVAPDIEAANILYRSILYFARGESGGVVVGGLVPVILLSRAETPDTKLRSIAIARLVAAAGAPGRAAPHVGSPPAAAVR